MRVIKCECGNKETLNQNERKWDTQNFIWIKSKSESQSLYECKDCKESVESKPLKLEDA